MPGSGRKSRGWTFGGARVRSEYWAGTGIWDHCDLIPGPIPHSPIVGHCRALPMPARTRRGKGSLRPGLAHQKTPRRLEFVVLVIRTHLRESTLATYPRWPSRSRLGWQPFASPHRTIPPHPVAASHAPIRNRPILSEPRSGSLHRQWELDTPPAAQEWGNTIRQRASGSDG